MASVPAFHQELDRAAVRGSEQGGELVHGVVDDAGRTQRRQDVVAYAGVPVWPDPAAHGLEPDLSDLIVVHAITGDVL
ncbi:hypothetical protein [Streptomyces sp. CC228A]|uniref:hypothetical protein n=1 Tax=Streptomyces sp. CC228A TaxID=2898186 RepID=UPI001F257213|nr:hypothetical protein [Streptomyces sp. CC228A]